MGRTPCCLKVGLNRGPWTPEEDLRLGNYIEAHGEGGWRTLPKKAGLLRCGKSCRLRWMNYLRPDVKHGHILPEEEDLILRLHRLLGNRWSLIAGRMPGRTDNEVKNYWNTHLSKKLISQGIDPRTHKLLSESEDICSSPGNSEVSHKSQRENNTEIPRNVADGAADFHDAMASKGGAIAEDQTSAKSLAKDVNQPLETSISQTASAAIDFVPQAPLISSAPYTFQQSIASTCVPGGVSDSVEINHNKGSKQISFPHITNASTAYFNSSSQEGVVRDYLDQYLMKNHVTSSNDMITSTVRLNSALQTAPFVEQFDSSHAFISGNALLKSSQAMEMDPHHCFIVNPSEEATCNKLSHTRCAAPDQITPLSYPYLISPTAVGAALGDFSSDIFPSFLESFTNEELQLQEPGAHTSIAQNVQLCPSNQPKAENVTSYDLWSILSPSSQYHP